VALAAKRQGFKRDSADQLRDRWHPDIASAMVANRPCGLKAALEADALFHHFLPRGLDPAWPVCKSAVTQ
jgi:hypothetical protein